MNAEDIAAGLNARKSGPNSWKAKCPAHDDKRPSLHITEKNGRTLIHCFAGCPQESVLQKLRELGLWTLDSLSPAERELRQREREGARRTAVFYSHELDDLKEKARKNRQWEKWMALCDLQFQVKKKAGLV